MNECEQQKQQQEVSIATVPGFVCGAPEIFPLEWTPKTFVRALFFEPACANLNPTAKQTSSVLFHLFVVVEVVHYFVIAL